MKSHKALILIVVILFSLTGAQSQDGFTIKGKIKGLEEGMFLTLGNQDKNNEIGRFTPKKNGSFEFTGKVDEICRGIIRVFDGEGWEGYVTSVNFYLENEEYELKADLADLKTALLTGTSEQNNIANVLKERSVENRKRYYELQGLMRNRPTIERTETFERDGEVRERTVQVLDSSKIVPGQYEQWLEESSTLNAAYGKMEGQFVDEHTNSYHALVILNRVAAANKRKYDEEERAKKLQAKDRPRPQNPRGNMTQQAPTISDEDLADYYEEFSRKLKKTTVGKAFYTNLYERLAVKVGDKYYEYDDDVIDLDEKSFKIADVDTEYVLMSFTSTGCSGCQKFNNAMIPKYDLIKDKIKIVAYYTDLNIDYVRAHTEKKQIKWEVVSDYKGNNSPVKNRYQIHAIPQFFLLDKDRNIMKYIGGYSEEFIDYLVDLGQN